MFIQGSTEGHGPMKSLGKIKWKPTVKRRYWIDNTY